MATDKQEKVAEILANSGKSTSKAMLEAGYSKAMAKNPQVLKKSKGWAKLMEKYLPDKHLADKHKEFLNAPRIVRTYRKGDLEIETVETDSNAVKALDMAYKLKGKYAAEKKEVTLDESGQEVIKAILDSLRTT